MSDLSQGNKHKERLEEFIELCAKEKAARAEKRSEAAKAKAKKAKFDDDVQLSTKTAKQMKSQLGYRLLMSDLNQASFEDYLVELFVREMLPLERVESKNYRLFFKRLVGPIQWKRGKLRVISRGTLRARIVKKYHEMLGELSDALKEALGCAETSDIWTAHRRAYIAVTCHWIDPESMCRLNCVLTLEPFKGRHTYRRIARRLYKINVKFDILDKTTHLTTDGG
jgi:hypothetical protein